MKIKSVLLLFSLTMSCLVARSQDDSKPNIVKFNLLSAIGNTASLEYERAIFGKFSLNGSVALMPKNALPFKSIFSKITNESSIINSTDLGAFSMALEGRYYVNKKSPLEGVYVAPFVKYSKYSASTEVKYGSGAAKSELPLSGDFNAVTGGLALGVQWVFSKHITVDWRIVGIGYGSSKGTLEGQKALTAANQKEIREELEDLDGKLPIIKMKSVVDDNGVKSTIDGGWLGIRTGLSIGYNF